MISSVKLPSAKFLSHLAGASLFLFLAANLSAQTTDTISVSEIKNDVRFSEWQLKNFGQSRKPQPRTEPIAWRQVQEDFLQMQIESGELQKSVAAASLDYRHLKNLTNQIKKRAARLKRDLPLPAPESATAGESELQIETLEIAVKTLDEAVIRFTGNPVFKQALVVDLDGGAQAARDLQTIIALGDVLKKRIESAKQNE